MRRRNHTRRGFTVIEVSIVSIVTGIALLSLLDLYSKWLIRHRINVTKTRIETIQNAMQSHMNLQKMVPCAAPLTAGFNDPAAGVATDCAAAPVAGTTSAPGRTGNVRIGAVPTQDLEIPRETGLDGWGRRMTYAVSETMTTVTGFSNAEAGDVFVRDSNGNPVISPDGGAVYTVVSHGRNGLGSFSDSGIAQSACVPTTLEGQNCDGDARFIYTPLFSEAGDDTNFDDLIGYSSKSQLSTPGVVSFTMEKMGCNVTSCTYGSPCTPNKYGQACASAILRNNDMFINPPAETPVNGTRIYSSTFTAKTDGDVVVRATIPVRLLTQSIIISWTGIVAWQGTGKEAPIMAAVYLTNAANPTGIEIGRGLIMDPGRNWGGSQGVTGAIVGKGGPIEEGQNYMIDIYVFSLGDNNALGPTFVGTINIHDHSVDGMVEIMETGSQ